MTKCGGCGSTSLSETFNFGDVPIAGHFPAKPEDALPMIPMILMFCDDCSLVQVSPDVDDRYLFTDYRYISSISMRDHFEELADWFSAKENPEKNARILEIGCNDGPLLDCLTQRGFSPIGIDPATNIVEKARGTGLNIINDFFDESALQKYDELHDLDYIFSANSFAHISDIKSIAEAVSRSLSQYGKFIVEVQSLTELVKTNAFDFVYHEHKYYYTIKSISHLMGRAGMHLEHCEMLEVHGGSYRLIFSKQATSLPTELLELIREENRLKLDSTAINQAVNQYILALKSFDACFEEKRLMNKKIIAFGASGRANMLLAHLPKIRQTIPFVIDESPERVGRHMAQNLVPIKAFSDVDCRDFEVVLVLAWNFSKTIIEKWPKKVNVEFVIPLPSLQVISTFEDKT